MLQKYAPEIFGLEKFKPDDPARSYTLPADLYYRQDVFYMEKQAIFHKAWNFV